MPHPYAVSPSIVQGVTDGLICNLAYDAEGHVQYVGYASPGSANSDAVWQIQRLTWVNGKLTMVRFAGGAEFNQSWTDLASKVYA